MSDHMRKVWTSRIVVVSFHLLCFLVLAVGFSWPALIVAFLAYVIRGFGITGGYHRFFSHNAFQTGPTFRTVLGVLGTCAVQGDPKKWALEHRHHHRESDQPDDLHSPKQPSFFWSHIGWILSAHEPEVKRTAKDLDSYPELAWLGRNQHWVILGYLAFTALIGAVLGIWFETSALQMLVWAGIISTVFTWHVTWCVNSVTHTFGSRRWETKDDSRNNWWIGVLALGEGHHNNHHHRPALARQGLLWWEFDFTYYVLKALEALGVVWALNEPEPEVFIVARSLQKMRSKLARRQVPTLTLSERLKSYQAMMSAAVQKIGNLRRTLTESLNKKLISYETMLERLKEGAAEFTASLRQAEALATA